MYYALLVQQDAMKQVAFFFFFFSLFLYFFIYYYYYYYFFLLLNEVMAASSDVKVSGDPVAAVRQADASMTDTGGGQVDEAMLMPRSACVVVDGSDL
ncbi:hypothetical protein BDZ91DRAFT_714450 [Kalaharituber pfeilii]|nr:hypothetical protein BDZ91DRAFT_714450 [Kalaharituber pfeilii]